MSPQRRCPHTVNGAKLVNQVGADRIYKCPLCGVEFAIVDESKRRQPRKWAKAGEIR